MGIRKFLLIFLSGSIEMIIFLLGYIFILNVWPSQTDWVFILLGIYLIYRVNQFRIEKYEMSLSNQKEAIKFPNRRSGF